MPHDDIVADLARARLERVPRGYAALEVDDFFSQTADRIRAAGSTADVAAIVRDMEQARFTPEANGYEPFAVRSLLSRTAAALNEARWGNEKREVAVDTATLPEETIDRAVDRLESYEHQLTARLAHLASQAAEHGSLDSEVAQLREEIAIAGETLRDLLRQITSLRRRAREELRREVEALREEWLADLRSELAAADPSRDGPWVQREP